MFILLEERDGDPLYVQIYRQIKEMIAAGQLRPGERLPSTRALAATLAVGRNTVENAYAQLVVEGYVSSRQGSGYEVQPLVELGPCPPPAP
ncbi:GntR family transcriptional regulator, partial [Clostridium sp. ATCC 29733]